MDDQTHMNDAGPTFKVVRYYQNDDVKAEVVAQGLTLADATAMCRDPETSSFTATSPAAVKLTEKFGNWFCGFVEEE